MLAIEQMLWYNIYSILIGLRIFKKVFQKIKIFLKILQPNEK